MKLRVTLGVVALVLLVVVGARAVRAVQRASAVSAVCDATDPAQAVALGEGLVESLPDDDPLLPVALECRCATLVAAERGHECGALVGATLDRAGGDWLDDTTLDPLLRHLFDARDAVAVDRVLSAAAPHVTMDTRRLRAWWAALAILRNGPHTVADFLPHVRAIPPAESFEMRLEVAAALVGLGMPKEAFETLEPAPAAGDPLLHRWYRTRVHVAAEAGDVMEVTRTLRAWEAAGGNRLELYAIYALELSQNHLFDAQKSPLQLLREAVEVAPDELSAEDREGLWMRLIMEESNHGDPQRVPGLVVAARAKGVDVDAALVAQISRTQATAAPGGLKASLKLPPAAAGGTVDLLVFGPEPDARPERVPVPADGVVPLHIADPAHPTRWVARTATGALLASGTSADGGALTVPAREATAAPSPADISRRPADGRRRVYVVIGDCVDWHLLRYLEARGDLPVLSAMTPTSVSGVLSSVPAYTGIAMEKIAHPSVNREVTVARYLHSLGVELQGLESVGVNPLSGLRWVMPESPYLAELIGAGPARALNLLYSHGDIEAGRNAEVVGPDGKRTVLDLAVSRLLTPEEDAAILLGTPEEDVPRAFLGEMAAELDEVVKRVGAADTDLVLLRVEQTDLLTHGTFPRLLLTGVDDGRGALYTAYRYVDRRLGDVLRASDEDDVVIYMSDHGIENSLVHSPNAVFYAYGLGRAGTVTGRPDLEGMPRLLTRLLGVQPDERWPASTLPDQVLGPPGP